MSPIAIDAAAATGRPTRATMRRWTRIWCGVAVLFGVVLAGAAFPFADTPARALLALMGDIPTVVLDRPLRFAMALMGAVTIGWGLTIAVAIDAIAGLEGPADRVRLRRRLLAAVSVWFVVDSLLSIATGFALNAVSNSVLMAGFVALMLGWKSADRRGAYSAAIA